MEGRKRGELSFTYFHTDKDSFSIVARNQIDALRRKGYKVEEERCEKAVQERVYQNHFAIIHPFMFSIMYGGEVQSRMIDNLYKSFRYVIGFEVADTTKINRKYVDIINDQRVSAICVPSMFSYNSYKQSGVINRVYVIPHGVNEDFKPEPITHQGIRVLTFSMHTGRRKGLDVFLNISKRFPEINFIVKGGSEQKFKNVERIRKYLSEEELIKLYNSCDIFLYGYRSGSFELPVLEGMACGLPLVATGWGCILDYVNLHNSYLSDIVGCTRIFPSDNMHNGDGAEPNLDSLESRLRYVINNLDECKEKAIKTSKYIKKKFNWDNSIQEFIRACKEVMKED